MSQLNADGATIGMDEINHLLQRLDLAVLPEAQICRADAASRIDGRAFGQDQTSAAEGELPKVDHVPRRRAPGFGRMLAHGRDDDPIVQNQLAKLDRLE